MDEKNYNSSDSDDSDYVVDQQDDVSDSSVESEFEATSEIDDSQENSSNKIQKKKNNKKQKKSKTLKTRLSRTENKPQPVDSNSSNESSICTITKDEKERADSLWQSFLTETSSSSSTQSRNKSTVSTNTSHTTSTQSKEEKSDSTIVKEINLKSSKKCESKIVPDECQKFNNKKLPSNSKESADKCTTSAGFLKENNLKKRGISSILNNINKKPKITVLEKSKLDWNQFKDEHNLNEEITNFNRGKNGYLEKQDFLQRTDSRQFEIEKELRNIGKRKI